MQMGILDQCTHLLNFFAPAISVGVLLALVAPVISMKWPESAVLSAQAAINSIAGSMALCFGLWFFGRDGKMASYAAMLVACTLSQGFFKRG
jgi:hypothetical protein